MIDYRSKRPSFSSIFPYCPCKADFKDFDFKENWDPNLINTVTPNYIYAYCRHCLKQTELFNQRGLSWNESEQKLVKLWIEKHGQAYGN